MTVLTTEGAERERLYMHDGGMRAGLPGCRCAAFVKPEEIVQKVRRHEDKTKSHCVYLWPVSMPVECCGCKTSSYFLQGLLLLLPVSVSASVYGGGQGGFLTRLTAALGLSKPRAPPSGADPSNLAGERIDTEGEQRRGDCFRLHPDLVLACQANRPLAPFS